MVKMTNLQEILSQGETLTIEFKSDRGPLEDVDLLNTVVCMANAQGGTLLVGVEDDCAPTGLHPSHRTRPELLTAFIASRTVPPLTVQTSFETLQVGGREITLAALRIPASSQIVATSDGRTLTRYLDTHGKPGCRPLYPHEFTSWRAERGQVDLSALPVSGATWDDLDPLEFVRLRRMVEENRGDAALLELSDQQIAIALGLVHSEDGMLTPTLAGLLLVGKESALRKHVPAHEVAFQVLRGTDVAVNEFRRWPLLRVHEWLMQAIDVRNEEQELMVGSFRVGVPHYDRRGMREAINNALIHRDYGRLGTVHIQLHDDYALVANPGGFVVGVRPDNLLAVPPHPRNFTLADAFKRVGLVERTGRGVDIIYVGQLQNGRPAPSYARTTEASVTVTLNSGSADLDFVLLSIKANRLLGRTLRVDDFLVLWEVWHEGSVEAPTLTPLLQQDLAHVTNVLAELADTAVLQVDGPIYRLAADLRTAPHKPLDPQSAILGYVQTHGRVTRREVVRFCDLSEKQAEYRLKQLVEAGRLQLVGKGRNAHYTLFR